MDRESIIKLINTRIQNQSLEVGALSTSSHTHNGADSPQVQSKDINTLTGFYFGAKDTSVSLEYSVTNNAIGFVAQTPTTNFAIGTFNDINFLADDKVQSFITVGGNILSANILAATYLDTLIINGTNVTDSKLEQGIQSWSILGGGTFLIKLPATGQPTAVAGGIYYNGTNFYACADGANWQVINLT